MFAMAPVNRAAANKHFKVRIITQFLELPKVVTEQHQLSVKLTLRGDAMKRSLQTNYKTVTKLKRLQV